MQRKILIAAGGTAGHLYPALAVAHKLAAGAEGAKILFVGAGLSDNRFFDRSAFAFQAIDAAPLSRKPWPLLKNCVLNAQGLYTSLRILADYQPHLVVGFGSYCAFPILLAAKMRRYPIVLHEQNSKPGKVIRFFARKALMVGTYFPLAETVFSGKAVQMAMPLREGFTPHANTTGEAYDYFKLSPRKFTLLVFGGSQGAHFINQIVADTLLRYGRERCDLQLLHFAGSKEQADMLAKAYAGSSLITVVKPFEPRIDLALRIADLMITRAGAGTIAEQLAFHVPAIFIPYPYAADNHQEYNADYVVNTVRGGWKLLEKNLNSEQLNAVLSPLLSKDSSELQTKKANLIRNRQQSSHLDFADHVKNIVDDSMKTHPM